MKDCQHIDTLILNQLTPERHSIGAIKDTNIVENVAWHQHRETEIIYMEQAYGTFLLGDNLISFDSEDREEFSIIILLGSLLAHSFFNDSKVALDHSKKSNVISVLFHEAALGEPFFNLPEMKNVKQLLEKASGAYLVVKDNVQELANLMEELCESEGVNRLVCFLKMLGLIATPTNIEQVRGQSMASREHANDLLTNIIRYLHENYQKDLVLGEIARMHNMSVSTFCSFFKRYTGQTFIEYLNRLRISKACERLLTSDDDITSIGFACGFNNLSNFNRRFKQFKKESPRNYRSRYSPCIRGVDVLKKI
ncbi:MAG: AraC family transcriptional regulator [Desulfovibrionales bacterium]|nr:AraC family transcriptional regulator [Desulfovibrionales bacterium]